MIEEHTDSRPFAGKSEYSNWELSSDRANGAAVAAANRRVSVIVRYQNPPADGEAKGNAEREHH